MDASARTAFGNRASADGQSGCMGLDAPICIFFLCPPVLAGDHEHSANKSEMIGDINADSAEVELR